MARSSKKGFPLEDKLNIELKKLITHDGSFIDKLMETNKFENRKDAEQGFYSKFTNIFELEGSDMDITKP